MAISNNYVPLRQLGNGVTTQFSGNWAVLAAAYMLVYLESVSTGVQTLQVLGVDYTLVFTSAGFTVTFITAPTSANYVVIGRDVSIDQTDPYSTSKGFQGGTLEDSLDKLTAISQDNAEAVGRAIVFPFGSSLNGKAPTPIDDATLAWDGVTGDLKNGPTVAYITTVIPVAAGYASAAAASAAAAQASADALAAGYTGTSTSSIAIGTGGRTFTTQSGKLWAVGQLLQIASTASSSNYMHGVVTSYSGTSLVMNVLDVGGSGTLASWTISLSGSQGPQGAAGTPGGPTGTLTQNHIYVGNASGVATDVAMSGDATIVSSGAITLSTVNSNVGSFTGANITVDAKGRVTAASNGSGGTGFSILAQQFFTGSGTYTPTAGMKYCMVESVSGGGGGGGVKVASAANVAVARGGEGSSYGLSILTAAQIGASKFVTIGAGGAGGNNTGTGGSNGGATSLGSLHVGVGGTGRSGSVNATTTDVDAGNVGGFVNLYVTADVSIAGKSSGPGWAAASPLIGIPCLGGDAAKGWGFGAAANSVKVSGAVAGMSAGGANSFGGGGGGALSLTTTTGAAGGTGANGAMLITEFC